MKNLFGVIATAAMLALAACGGGGGGGVSATPTTPAPEAKAPEAGQLSLAERIGAAEFGSIYQGTRPVMAVNRDRGRLNRDEIKLVVEYEGGSTRSLIFDYGANVVEGDAYISDGDLTAFVVQKWRGRLGYGGEAVWGTWWHDESDGELGVAWVDVPDADDGFHLPAIDSLPIVARGQAQGPVVFSNGSLEEALTDIRVDIGGSYGEFSIGAALGEQTGGIEIIGASGDPIDKIGQTFSLEGTHARWDGYEPLYIGSPEGVNAVTSGNAEGSWGGIALELNRNTQLFGTIHLHSIQGRDDIDSILFLWDANDLP